MGLLTTAGRMGKQAAAGFVACVLLLPLPALAYTISTWSFSNNGVSLSDNSADHKTLNFGGAAGGSGFNAMGTSTLTATAGETANVTLDMTGLKLIVGTLTVTVQIGGTTKSEVITAGTMGPGLQRNFGSYSLVSGNQAVKATFRFSIGAVFTYTASTAGNLFFR